MIGGRPARLAFAATSVAVAAPGALAALHLTTLTAASLLPPRRRPPDGRRRRLLVLIPARNEERLISRAVAPLVAQRRPGDIVMVVADRCTDRTATLAAAAGAEVLERPADAAPGKGAAINDGLRAMAERPWDALVTVDADSIVADGFLDACDAALQTGAAAVQSRSEALPGCGVLTHAAVVASALQGVVAAARPRPPRPRRAPEGPGDGRAPRRRSTAIRSRARAAPRTLATASTSCSRRSCPCTATRPRSDHRAAADCAAASGQRLRWEAGRVHLARHYVLPLLRAGTPSAWEAAVHLATPPLAVAVGLLGAGATLAALAGAQALVAAEATLAAAVAVDVMVALAMAGGDRRAWAALALAPAYVGWKGVLQARALLGSGSRRERVRADRSGTDAVAGRSRPGRPSSRRSAARSCGPRQARSASWRTSAPR